MEISSEQQPLYSSAEQVAAASQPTHPPIRSCERCRHRKVKCDKRSPCSSCVRAEAECISPDGRGRAPKRPRKAVDYRLGDRLARVEAILKHLANPGNSNTDSSLAAPKLSHTSTSSDVRLGSSDDSGYGKPIRFRESVGETHGWSINATRTANHHPEAGLLTSNSSPTDTALTLFSDRRRARDTPRASCR